VRVGLTGGRSGCVHGRLQILGRALGLGWSGGGRRLVLGQRPTGIGGKKSSGKQAVCTGHNDSPEGAAAGVAEGVVAAGAEGGAEGVAGGELGGFF
jgi:hypothetical protein